MPSNYRASGDATALVWSLLRTVLLSRIAIGYAGGVDDRQKEHQAENHRDNKPQDYDFLASPLCHYAQGPKRNQPEDDVQQHCPVVR